nr:hypothetical protein [Rickettsia endosymbiont of Ceutorhynchus assimilis]
MQKNSLVSSNRDDAVGHNNHVYFKSYH